MIDMEKVKREEVRWRVLAVLNAGRPERVSESLILRVLHDVTLDITPAGLRKEIDYLESRKLVDVAKNAHDVWLCELTYVGVDVVEYTVPCDPGIARPVQR